MDPRQALDDVATIRAHLARTEAFRGYRSTMVAFTGAVGAMAALGQAYCLPNPAEDFGVYLLLWISAAGVNVLVSGAELWRRAAGSDSPLARRTTLRAVEQFLPSLVAGALLTLAIARHAAESAWMLPGLWAVVFSLGIFASARLLHRAVALAGVWYLSIGVLALAWGRGHSALTPWSMGLAFGGGQFLTALILYLALERPERGEERQRG